MRRTYDRGRYMDRVAQIREHLPDCALTTDIIVGFPGETEEDFERDARGRRRGRLRRRLHVHLLASPRHRRRGARRHASAPREAGADGAARAARPAPRRASARSVSSGGRWRSWSRARAETTRSACAGAPATTRRSTSTGSPAPGELAEVEIESATSTDPRRQRADPQPRRLSRGAEDAWTSSRSSARRRSARPGSRSCVAKLLRERGEDPVAVSCDALQVYRGLEDLTAAPSAAEREWLEHRLVGIAEVDEEFSAGRFAELARREIDELLAEGRRPIVVGGTGLYLRAALAESRASPAGPGRDPRRGRGRDRGARARAAARQLDPALRASVHPNDRKRIARALELQRAGLDPPAPRRRRAVDRRAPPPDDAHRPDDGPRRARGADRRAGATRSPHPEPSRRPAAQTPPALREPPAPRSASRSCSRATWTAYVRAQRAFARRQLTWMRRLEGATVIDRTGRDDADVAAEIAALLDS